MGLFSKPKEEQVVDIFNGKAFDGYKRLLHVYVINNEQCFIRLNSFDALENRSLFDAPIIKVIPNGESYFETFLRAYKEYTGFSYKQVQNDKNEVAQPRVFADTLKKTLIYILVIKDTETIDTARLTQVKFVYDWLSISEFVKTISSDKFVNYGKGYNDFVVLSMCELFNMEDCIKSLKYTSKQGI